MVDTTKIENKTRATRVRRRRRLLWLKDMAGQPLLQQRVGLDGMRLCWLRGKLRENGKFCLSHSGLDLSLMCQGQDFWQAVISAGAEQAGLGAWVKTWCLNCFLHGKLSRYIKWRENPSILEYPPWLVCTRLCEEFMVKILGTYHCLAETQGKFNPIFLFWFED